MSGIYLGEDLVVPIVRRPECPFCGMPRAERLEAEIRTLRTSLNSTRTRQTVDLADVLEVVRKYGAG